MTTRPSLVAIAVLVLSMMSTQIALAATVWGPGDGVGANYTVDSGLAYMWWGCSFSGNIQVSVKAYDPDGQIYLELREYQQNPLDADTFDGIPYNLIAQAKLTVAYEEWAILNLQTPLSADRYYVLFVFGTDANGNPQLTAEAYYKVWPTDEYNTVLIVRVVDYGNDGSYEPQPIDYYGDPVLQVVADQADCTQLVDLRVVSVQPTEGGVKVRFYLDGLPQGREFHAHIAADPDGDGKLDVVSRDSKLVFEGAGVYEIVVGDLVYTPWHVRVVWQEGGNQYEKISEPRTDVYIVGWGGFRTLINTVFTVAPLAVKAVLILLPYAGAIWSVWFISSLIRAVEELSIAPIIDFFYRNFNIVMWVLSLAKTAAEASATLLQRAAGLIKKVLDVIL